MTYTKTALVLLAVILLAAAWHQVFVMTGILWWDAPRAAVQQQPPPPLEFAELDSSWIDLEAWQRTHPVWAALR